MTPWTGIAAQWTPDGLYAQASEDGVGSLLGVEDNEARDALVQSVGIDLMTDFYRQKLIQKFREDYPDDVQSIETAIMRLRQQANEYNDYAQKVGKTNDAIPTLSGFLQTAMAWPNGSSPWFPTDQTYGYCGDIFPRLFFAAPPITSGLFAGVAEAGEFLVLIGPASDGSDMPANRNYINRGTRASPSWVAFDSDALIDFITNPTELLNCGYLRAMANLQSYAMNVPASGRLEWNYTYLPTAIKSKMNELTEKESAAFALIRPSLTGAGFVTDFEKRVSTKRRYIF